MCDLAGDYAGMRFAEPYRWSAYYWHNQFAANDWIRDLDDDEPFDGEPEDPPTDQQWAWSSAIMVSGSHGQAYAFIRLMARWIHEMSELPEVQQLTHAIAKKLLAQRRISGDEVKVMAKALDGSTPPFAHSAVAAQVLAANGRLPDRAGGAAGQKATANRDCLRKDAAPPVATFEEVAQSRGIQCRRSKM